jgi:peptidoglycan/xylan/chitin deacetylase (PgdA/CDA1 family)
LKRLALKVDCDTYVGTRDGVPRLLEALEARGIRSTFFFSYGPDRSGVAIKRVFTKPGFLTKMLRSRAVSLYGFPTILYGTFLASPMIGQRCAGQMKAAARAGHEVAVHAWDHVGWHDHVDRWSVEKIREESDRAHDEHRRIFGEPARASAAAGWACNAKSLAVEAEKGLLYTSNTRGGAPFFPSADGRVFETLEVPSTLPTLDETLSWPEVPSDEDQLALYRGLVKGTEVHSIHVEVEGRSRLPLFCRMLDAWIADGVTFLTLEQLAREVLAQRDAIPARPLIRTRLRGRGGEVATGWPEGSSGPG